MRDGRDQCRGTVAMELEEPQEAAQRTGRHLGRAGATTGGVTRGEGHQVLRADGRPVDGPVAELASEESPGVAEPIGARSLGQATRVGKMPAIAFEDRFDRGEWGRRPGSLKRTSRDAQQATEGGADLTKLSRGRC